MTYEEAIGRLAARGREVGFGIKPDLSRITALMELLNGPQRNYPVVHVAGTNGKSSTTRMIASILGAHGIKTGLYTSPHLQSPRERFVLAGLDEEGTTARIISKQEFAEVSEYLDPFLELIPSALTYFEFTTALAFEWFSDQAVQAAVIEVGLGGAWDATNVADGAIAVLTPIDVDHVSFLGRTPRSNAREKVGIIKPGSTVVSAAQAPDVMEVIAEAAGQAKELIQPFSGREALSDQPAVGGRLVSVPGRYAEYSDVFLPLFGAHQSSNLVLAVAACESLLDQALDEQALREGLLKIHNPGRLEVVSRDPLVVIDGAHNPHAARAIGPALVESFGDVDITMVVSIFEDKDVEGILAELSPYANRFVFTRSSHERAVDPRVLADVSSSLGKEASIVSPLAEALGHQVPRDAMVLVTGSLAAAGEARALFLGPID